MSDTLTIVGTALEAKSKDWVRIKSPTGDVFVLPADSVSRTESIEPGGDLSRYVLAAGATVHLEIEGDQLIGIDQLDSTILKWRDDGGTMSKSRDDI